MSNLTSVKTARRRARLGDSGFTLVELLSYFGLSVLLLSIMGLFLFSVLKQYAFVGDRFTLKKISSIVVREIKRDCESATLRSITPGDNTLIVQPFSSVDPPALFVWSNQVICYKYDPNLKRISRWEQGLSDFPSAPGPSNPRTFSTADGESLLVPTDGRLVKTWSFIETFSVSKESSTLIKVSLSLYLKDSKEHKHRYSKRCFAP